MQLSYKGEVKLLIKPKKMPVLSHEYDICFPFVWYHVFELFILPFVILKGTFHIKFSLVFDIFVILKILFLSLQT